MSAKPTITLPREMDEDFYYMIGSAMGAESPAQCGRADQLWKKIVARADEDAAILAATQGQPDVDSVIQTLRMFGVTSKDTMDAIAALYTRPQVSLR